MSVALMKAVSGLADNVDEDGWPCFCEGHNSHPFHFPSCHTVRMALYDEGFDPDQHTLTKYIVPDGLQKLRDEQRKKR